MALSMGVDDGFTEITPLIGGLHCQAHVVTHGDRRFVVKRFPAGDCRAAVEFENLSVISELNVPTPEPMTLDEKGAWFGTPTFVMTVSRDGPTSPQEMSKVGREALQLHWRPSMSSTPVARPLLWFLDGADGSQRRLDSAATQSVRRGRSTRCTRLLSILHLYSATTTTTPATCSSATGHSQA